MRLWLRHPLRAAGAWLWLARKAAPAFDRPLPTGTGSAPPTTPSPWPLPGHGRTARRARAVVLREPNAGRLPAVTASGLLTRPGVHDLHRARIGGRSPDPPVRPGVMTGRQLRTHRTVCIGFWVHFPQRHEPARLASALQARRCGQDRHRRRPRPERPVLCHAAAVASPSTASA
jgi:hypothetical protein